MGCFSTAAWVVLAASITLVSARPVTTISTLTPRYDTVDQDYTIGGILIPVTIAIAFAILLRAIVLRARRRRAYHPQPRPQQTAVKTRRWCGLRKKKPTPTDGNPEAGFTPDPNAVAYPPGAVLVDSYSGQPTLNVPETKREEDPNDPPPMYTPSADPSPTPSPSATPAPAPRTLAPSHSPSYSRASGGSIEPSQQGYFNLAVPGKEVDEHTRQEAAPSPAPAPAPAPASTSTSRSSRFPAGFFQIGRSAA